VPTNAAFRTGLETIAPSLVPQYPERHVYSILRELWLQFFADFLEAAFSDSPERDSKTSQSQKMMRELRSWLFAPVEPLTTADALQLLSKISDPSTQEIILRSVGRRSHRGQPASKRHLAIFALDVKYAFPHLTLRAATDLLCPCGKGANQKHSNKCREQMRQQINRAVKLLRTFGYDFTWERIGT
jgi:hypothetical protein